GPILATNLAAIYAQVGERDLALEQLARLIEVPNGPTPGTLRIEPEWDALRGDPRFDKIVASLAPKYKGQAFIARGRAHLRLLRVWTVLGVERLWRMACTIRVAVEKPKFGKA